MRLVMNFPQQLGSFAAHVTDMPRIKWPHPAYDVLQRGIAILPDVESVGHYYSAYGSIHVERVTPLLDALIENSSICKRSFQTVDWGCGALLATYLLRDRLHAAGLAHHHRRAVGTDASEASLRQATAWWPHFGIADAGVVLHHGRVDATVEETLASLRSDLPTLHLAANFLDLPSLNHTVLGKTIGQAMRPGDVFAAVSPCRGFLLNRFEEALGTKTSIAPPDYTKLSGKIRSTSAFIIEKTATLQHAKIMNHGLVF